MRAPVKAAFLCVENFLISGVVGFLCFVVDVQVEYREGFSYICYGVKWEGGYGWDEVSVG